MSRDTIVETLDHFEGERREVGVGYKFDGYDDGDTAVSTGDVAVFNDPDAGNHASGCELVHRDLIVAYVDTVYAVDYSTVDGYSVEVGTTGPLGRLSVGDAYTAVVTEDGVVGGSSILDPHREASRLVDNDDYDRYYQETWHLGEDGVPDDLWDAYADSRSSGPNCPYCTGEKGQDGMKTTGK